MYWWIIRILAYVCNKWCVYLCGGDTKEYIMVGLGHSVKRFQTSRVGFNCLHHLATILIWMSSERSYILVFFVYMYSVDFVPTLGGAILPALIIGPRSFFTVSGRECSMGSCSRARGKFMCYVLYMLWLVSVCVLILSSGLGRGSIPCGGGWVCVVSSLSMASDIAGVCYVLLFNLCILVLVLFGRVVAA